MKCPPTFSTDIDSLQKARILLVSMIQNNLTLVTYSIQQIRLILNALNSRSKYTKIAYSIIVLKTDDKLNNGFVYSSPKQ
jgi:hypothetical protein